MHPRKTLRLFFFRSSLFLILAGSSTCRLKQPSNVEVLVEHVERISGDEAQFRVRITNRSEEAVFLTGIVYESSSQLYPTYLEQQRAARNWKIVVPCMDTPPPHVIKLEPAKTMIENLVLKVPLEGVCKERDIQLEGNFRFRLPYFDSEKNARAYLKKLFSADWQDTRSAVALSEPFKIPQRRDLHGSHIESLHGEPVGLGESAAPPIYRCGPVAVGEPVPSCGRRFFGGQS